MNAAMSWTRAILLLLGSLSLTACVSWFAPPPGIGREIAFADLPGWQEDRHADAWPALLASCERRAGQDVAWGELCRAARAMETPDDARARVFFERYFRPHVLHGDGGREGLITGYYEPILQGSFTRTERFRVPLYRRPDDLLIVDLAGLYPELKGRPVRGRLEGNRVVPYPSRATITGNARALRGYELVWVDDPVEAFVLQVQGSGRVQLPDGSQVAVGYADQNGHPYRAVGATLIQRGALKREEVTLPRIRAWLAEHPEEALDVLNSNPSYIFFRLREAGMEGPVGSLGVPLTPGRSLAVDAAYLPLGVPVWLDTTLPDASPYRRLMLAQDTGGAIKGAVRADIFFGQGGQAGQLAGEMKNPGRLTVLLPRPSAPVTAVSQR